MSAGMSVRKADSLDKAVIYLQKRDGIDKVLKIIRYTTKLLTATVYTDSNTELGKRLNEFEKSIGTSRKAYRLGKFLGDLNALRKTPITTTHGVLEFVANSGEGLYYFIDQFIWLTKAGMLPPHLAKQLTKASAWAEAIGYCAAISLNSIRLYALTEREHDLVAELARRAKAGLHDADANKALEYEVGMLRARRLQRIVAVVQDCADMLLAVNDIRDGKGTLNNPVLLCLAGLLSALLSAHKNWRSI